MQVPQVSKLRCTTGQEKIEMSKKKVLLMGANKAGKTSMRSISKSFL